MGTKEETVYCPYSDCKKQIKIKVKLYSNYLNREKPNECPWCKRKISNGEYNPLSGPGKWD